MALAAASHATYRLNVLDLGKLLRRVATGGLSPRKAQALPDQAHRPGVRLMRGLIAGLAGLVFLVLGTLLLGVATRTYLEKQA